VFYRCGVANFGDGKIFTFNEGNALEMNRTRERERGELLAERKPLVT
jgi:hypothetical protein